MRRQMPWHGGLQHVPVSGGQSGRGQCRAHGSCAHPACPGGGGRTPSGPRRSAAAEGLLTRVEKKRLLNTAGFSAPRLGAVPWEGEVTRVHGGGRPPGTTRGCRRCPGKEDRMHRVRLSPCWRLAVLLSVLVGIPRPGGRPGRRRGGGGSGVRGLC